MNTTTDGPQTARARELVDLVMQGAEVNERPDLIRRLTAARHALAGAVRAAAGQVLRALESVEIDLRSRRTMLTDPHTRQDFGLGSPAPVIGSRPSRPGRTSGGRFSATASRPCAPTSTSTWSTASEPC